MLPFLKSKNVASVIAARRTQDPEGKIESQGPKDEPNYELLQAAEDLIRAVHSKDATAAAEALKHAVEVATSLPPDEPPVTPEGA